jgi:hypothetical protein
MCQPCWDQIVAIERELPKFRALGAGNLVSITGDPLHLLRQKMRDEGIKTPVLSDEGYAVSDACDARSYGMMKGQIPATASSWSAMLLTKADCGECGHGKRVLAALERHCDISVREVLLETPEGRELATRAGAGIFPVLFRDGQPYFYGRLSERRLRTELRDLPRV